MRMRKWLLIDEGNNVAYVGDTATLEQELNIKGQNLSRSVTNGYHLNALGYYYFDVIKLDYKYNFYDAETGELVAEEKEFDEDPELDETGYEHKELKKMLRNKPVDGLIAKAVLTPDINVSIPKELYCIPQKQIIKLKKDDKWGYR